MPSAPRLAALLVVAAACGGVKAGEAPTGADAGAPSGGAGAAPLPCAVDDVFARNCRSCHATEPRFGAPMALVTATDLQSPAKSDGGKKVYELVGARVHDASRPMPPSGDLPDADRKTLDAWIAAGAPAGAAACEGTTAAPPAADVGPQALPCPAEEQQTFVAHGADPTSPFAVPEDAGNLNMCFTWKAPWTTNVQATAFAPILDDQRVLHHWILFETATPQEEGGAGPCKMPLDATFLTGWAPGGTNREMPPDVGLELPKNDRWLILQIHYWNVARHKDVRDRSGVALCTTKPGALRPNTAVVATLGTLGINLPPRSNGVAATGTCVPELTEDAHVLSASPHMHTRGRTVKTTVLRGGDAARQETLVDVPRWDFEAQTAYPSGMVIHPGDVLKTTCTWDNPSSERILFGERTEDEMCFDFLTVYPPPGLQSGGLGGRRCLGR